VRSQDRTGGEIGDAGGLVTDWNLMTNLEGYFAAGDALFAANYHYHAATTGRYAGRKAANYAEKMKITPLDREQVQKEKAWVYKPLGNREEIEWKELNAAACRIMQNYCGEYKNEELLQLALISLKDLRENDAPRVCADNPHKLMRTLEVHNILTCDEMIVHASMARKASSDVLGFNRLDYPAVDPPEWKRWIVLRKDDGQVRTRKMPLDFWKPLAGHYEEHHS